MGSLEDHAQLLVLKSGHPELAEDVDEIDRLATQKLFHQMTCGLEKLVLAPCYQVAGNKDLVGLFNGFIRHFQPKIGDLRFIRLLQTCLGQLDPAEAVEALEPYLEKWKGTSHQVGTIIKGGWLAKDAGKLEDARELLTGIKDQLEGTLGIDAFVFSALYKNLAEIAKLQGDTKRFYAESLMYLSYTLPEDVLEADRPVISTEVTKAALLAPLEFNFGELLEKPLIKAELPKMGNGLRELLLAFHEGSFPAFDAVMSGPAPPLAEHKAALASKMALAALMELVFQRARSDKRTLGFAEIAEWCRTEKEKVEHLVMKALCLGLVEGKLDEVDQTVSFTRVRPRVLDDARIGALKTRLDAWAAAADALALHLDELTPELVVA